MQGNQNCSCGPLMRSNCCSHSTPRHVSCNKGSISSVARTQACSPPLLLLLLWDVAGFRGQRQEVEGWGYGDIVLESMRIHCPHEKGRAVFSGTAFSGSVWTIGQNDAIHVRFHKRVLSSGQGQRLLNTDLVLPRLILLSVFHCTNRAKYTTRDFIGKLRA